MAVASPATQNDREVLAGIVERVTVHNAETGFCVLRVTARGHRDLATIVGHAATISAENGSRPRAIGSTIAPMGNSQGALDAYLGAQFRRGNSEVSLSGMIRGIGPSYASKMVKAFGIKCSISSKPSLIGCVRSTASALSAPSALPQPGRSKIVREIMVFLHSHGVGTARAVRIYKTYNADAIQVTENPYRLARDIRGIGFKTADAIAIRLGIEKTALVRVRAGISYALTEAMDEGHCGLPTEELVPLAAELLEIPKELVAAALELEPAAATGDRRYG
jgi:exodeoxyribonuclease V alpha subunit